MGPNATTIHGRNTREWEQRQPKATRCTRQESHTEDNHAPSQTFASSRTVGGGSTAQTSNATLIHTTLTDAGVEFRDKKQGRFGDHKTFRNSGSSTTTTRPQSRLGRNTENAPQQGRCNGILLVLNGDSNNQPNKAGVPDRGPGRKHRVSEVQCQVHTWGSRAHKRGDGAY